MEAAVHETHVSVVFFVGDRVYKLKKPVRMDFLDFSTREARRSVCEREVELNRRLAPDVYLGVADVTGPDGAVCDHLVVMRRMPEERRLSTLAAAGAADAVSEIDRVARVIAAFHATAASSAEISAAGSPAAIERLWEDNLAEMSRFEGTVLDARRLGRVTHLARRYVGGRAPLFDARVAAGLVRDGHGDLLADDVFCLDDGPRILDCIEFDDRLRHGDVLADTAFLAMDLERLGRPDLAARFLDRYREHSAESHPASLAHHWIAYRALVRSKVAAIRAEQEERAGAARPGEGADRLLRMCEDHLERARVRLVIVGGRPGTGKSTLAEGIADARGWTLLRSDEVRKEQAGLDARTPAPAGYREGLYTEAATQATYDEMLRRARHALSMGETVVLDASWSSAARRADAAIVAEETAADLVEIRCDAPAGVADRRLRERAAAGADPSDATPAVAAAMAAHTDPWPTAHTVDTSVPVDEVVARALTLTGA